MGISCGDKSKYWPNRPFRYLYRTIHSLERVDCISLLSPETPACHFIDHPEVNLKAFKTPRYGLRTVN
jgi:hypothetical protein